MLLLLILPVLVAGFLACHIHPDHSYKLHRYEGQYLYLKSAELGLACFALAFVLGVFSHYQLPNSLTAGCFSVNIAVSKQLANAMMAMGAKDEDEALKLAWFFILSALTFLAAFIIKIWAAIRTSPTFRDLGHKSILFVIGKLLEDSPLDNLLFNLSLQRDKYVMLTMNDRKVYVGKVIDLGEPTETNGMDQDISIMPLGHSWLCCYYPEMCDSIE